MILAFDVTDKVAVFAWRSSVGEIGERRIGERKSAEIVLPTIQEITKAVGEPLEHLSVITGPGSFTGVRVGIATAMGLGLSLGIPIYGFTKFELGAWRHSSGRVRLVAQSGRDQLAILDVDEGRPLGDVAICSEDALAEQVKWVPIGAVVGLRSPEETSAALACAMIAETKPEPHQGLEPFYLRPPDAKRGRVLLDRLLDRDGDEVSA